MPKLTLVKCDGFEDWYTIERAEHEGRQWMKPIGPHSMALMCSSRISDADVEGTRAEMLEIAKAIRERKSAWFKRCAVSFNDGSAWFESPRNSTLAGSCALGEADELAAEIEAKLLKESDDAES